MKHTLRLIVLLLLAASGMGFSPYELHLRSGKQTHAGLLAELTDGEGFSKAATALATPDETKRLEKAEITSLQAFTRRIGGKNYALIYFAYRGGMDYIGAAEAFEKATESSAWAKLVKPHPRAERYGRTWLQMEWISFIRGMDVERAPTGSVMVGTTLQPDKEMDYRTLHQTVWPGVVDQVARAKSRNLCIWLVELDDLLVKFLYVEYMGEQEEKDAASSKLDPITLRWWKLTDGCQKPFSDFKDGIWAPLDRVE